MIYKKPVFWIIIVTTIITILMIIYSIAKDKYDY